MSITQSELENRIKTILDADSNNPQTDPEAARKRLAFGLAKAISDFVIGRLTKVTGITSDGKSVTGKGVIQNN
jgi:hypothetical protein